MAFKKQIERQQLKPVKIVKFALRGVVLDVQSGHAVVLHMKHAGDSNRGYANAKKRLMSTLPGLETKAEFLQAFVPLYAKHVIVGWDHVVEDDGQRPAYSPEKAEELLLLLASDEGGGADIVDEAFTFATIATNFRDAPIGDPEKLGKE